MAATTRTWTGLSGGSPTLASNWSPSGQPQAGDTAIISGGAAATPDYVDTLIDGVTFDLTGNGTLAFSNDTATAAGSGLGSLGVIDATGTATTVSIAGPFENQGTIEVTGTGASLAIAIAPGGSLINAGNTDGEILVAPGSTLAINGGTLLDPGDLQVNGVARIAATLSGLNNDAIGAGGTLELSQLGTAGLDFIEFNGTTGLLKLDNPQAFVGTIQGFGGSDTIDLGRVSVGSVTSDGAGDIVLAGSGGAVFSALLPGFDQSGTFALAGTGGLAAGLRITESSGGDTTITNTTTWTWQNGATASGTIAADWQIVSGPGNSAGYPQSGDTAIDAGGTILLANPNFQGTTLQLGGTAGAAALFVTGGSATTSARPSLDQNTVLTSAVAGNSTAETSLLHVQGSFVNAGTIVAAGPAGSTFTIAIADTTIGGTVPAGSFLNNSQIQVDAGNAMTFTGTTTLGDAGELLVNGGTLAETTGNFDVGTGTASGSLLVEGGGTLLTGGTNAVGGTLLIVGGSIVLADINAPGSHQAAATVTGGTWIANGSLIVGDTGSGTLTIGAGGVVNAGASVVEIGNQAGGKGTVTVGGAGAALLAGSILLMNATTGPATGTLTVGTGGTVQVTSLTEGTGGAASIAGGALLVTTNAGVGGLNLASGATLAASGGGTLSDAGTFNLTGGTLSLQAGGTDANTGAGGLVVTSGAVVVNGGTLNQNNGPLSVGDGGAATVTIQGGGRVTVNSATGLYVGHNSGGNGLVTVSNGTLSTPGAPIYVGLGALGTLSVQSGGVVSDTNIAGMFVGFGTGGNGIATVSGGTVSVGSGPLIVGDGASGTLTIQNGGLVSNSSAQAGMAIGFGGSGTVVVNAGTLAETNTITIGQSGGTGTLAVNAGGTVIATSGIVVNAGNALILGGGTLASGTRNAGQVSGFGTFSAALNNGGTVAATGGTLEVKGAISGTGSIVIAGGAAFRADTSLASTQAIGFAAGTETLILNAPGTAIANAITGLNDGDSIELKLPGSGTLGSAAMTSASTLTVVTSVGTYALTNVSFVAGPHRLQVGTDAATGDATIQVLPAPYTWLGWQSTDYGTGGNWLGTLTPSAGSSVLFAGNAGTVTGSGSALDVTVAGTSAWTFANTLTVAGTPGLGADFAGSAVLNGAVWTVGSTTVIDQPSGGTVTVSGGARLATGGLAIGAQTTGDLAINGGTVISTGPGGIVLGVSSAAAGTLTVAAGTLASAGGVVVGDQGTGSLAIGSGGLVSAAGNTINLGEAGSGAGTLTIGTGGTLAGGAIELGNPSGGPARGLLTVNAGGAVVLNGTQTTVIGGNGGSGTLVVAGGTVSATSSAIALDVGTGTLLVQTGGLLNTSGRFADGITGTGIVSGGTWMANAGVAIDGGAGSLDINTAGVVSAGSNEIAIGDAGNGAVTVEGGGTLAGNLLAIGNAAGSGASGSLIVAGGSVALALLSVNGGGTIAVSSGSLAISNSAAIGQEGTGAVVALTGGSMSTGMLTLGGDTGSAGTLTVSGGRFTANGSLVIGSIGNGLVTVNSGGVLTALAGLEVDSVLSLPGPLPGIAGSGTLLVTGGDVTAAGALSVGNGGTAIVTVSAGGSLALTGTAAAMVGNSLGGNAAVTVDAGTISIAGDALDIGGIGTASLLVEHGGTVSMTGGTGVAADISASSSGQASVTVTGTGSAWDITASGTALVVGDAGTGALDINSGGLLNAGTAAVILGNQSGGAGMLSLESGGSLAAGTLVLDNATSLDARGSIGIAGGTASIGSLIAKAGGTISVSSGALSVSGAAIIGQSGTGAVLTLTGGSVTAGALDIGGQNGSVAVSGAGASLAIAGSLAVGLFGSGSLTVSDGAVVSDFGSAAVGDGGAGALAISNGGVLNADGGIVIDSAYVVDGNVVVDGGGLVRVTGGTLNASFLQVGVALSEPPILGPVSFPSDGSLTIGQAGLVNVGSLATYDAVTIAGGTLESASTITGQTLGLSGLFANAPEISGYGTIIAPVLDDGIVASGGTLEFSGATLDGVAAIEAGAALQFDTAVAGSATVAFAGAGAGGTLILDAPGTVTAAAITGLSAGDRIDFDLAGGTISSAAITSPGTVTVVTSAGTYLLTDVSPVAGSYLLQAGTDAANGDASIQVVPAPAAWTGAASTDYGTAGNWLGFGVPIASDAALFTSNAGTVTGSGSALNVTIGGTGAWLFENTLTVSATAGVGAAFAGSAQLRATAWTVGAATIIDQPNGGTVAVFSTLVSTGLTIGAVTTGDLVVGVPGTVGAGAAGVVIGAAAGSAGTLDVAGGTLVSGGSLIVGNAGTATLLVEPGGMANAGTHGIAIANAAGSTGTVAVDSGILGIWQRGTLLGGTLSIANIATGSASGTLQISGGLVQAAAVDEGAGGLIDVGSSSGVGSSIGVLSVIGDIVVNGTLDEFAALVNAGSIAVGTQPSGTTAAAQVNGGTVEAGAVDIGTGGGGAVSVTAGGLLASLGTLTVGAQGAISLTGGTVAAPTLLSNAGAVSGGGTIAAAVVANDATIGSSSSGTLDVAGSVTGSGTLVANSGGTIRVGSLGSTSQTIAFNGTDAGFILDSPGVRLANPIVGLTGGDTIALNLAGATIDSVSVATPGTITVITNLGSYLLTDVSFAPGANEQFLFGTDPATGDAIIRVMPTAFVWTGAVSTDYATAGNWQSGVIPTGGDPVFFSGNPGTVTGTGNALQVAVGSSLNPGTWTFAASTLTVDAPLTGLGSLAPAIAFNGEAVLNGAAWTADASTVINAMTGGDTVTVEGGSTLLTAGLVVGESQGDLAVNGGTVVSTGPDGIIVGQNQTNAAVLTVANGTVISGAALFVGYTGEGTATVGSGGLLTSTGTFNAVGEFSGSDGALTVGSGGTFAVMAPSQAAVALGIGVSGSSAAGPAAHGAVLVSGTGALLTTNGSPLSVGGLSSNAAGTLTIAQGGSVSIGTPNSGTAAALLMGIGAGGTATLTVTDPNSALTANGSAMIGRGGNTTLLVENGGRMVVNDDTAGLGGIAIGDGQGSAVAGTASATVSSGGQLIVNSATSGIVLGAVGANGALTVNDGTVAAGVHLVVGGAAPVNGTLAAGRGTLSIGAGGTVSVGAPAQTNAVGITLGNAGTPITAADTLASGTATVSGAGALLTSASGIGVGYNGTGSLVVSQGGSVVANTRDSTQAPAFSLGRAGQGSAVLSGAGTALTVDGVGSVGREGTGTLTVESSAIAQFGTDANGVGGLYIGNAGVFSNTLLTGGSGSVDVNSGGSLISVGGIVVGQNGDSGTLTVENGGLVAVGTGGFQFGTGGTAVVTVQAGGTLAAIGPDSGTLTSFGIGGASGGRAAVTVNDGVFSVTGAGLAIGSTATVLVENGGSLLTGRSQGVSIVGGASAGATVTVMGVGSVWDFSGTGATLAVGGSGGMLQINSGGLVNAGTNAVAIGYATGSAGTIAINAGALVADTLNVGCAGSGGLSIDNGASVLASSGLAAGGVPLAGLPGSGTGVVSVGAHSTLTTNGVTLGDGVFEIAAGSGTLAVSGAGAVVNDTGTASVGDQAGSGTLGISNGGVFELTGTAATLTIADTALVAGHVLPGAGLVTVSNGTLTAANLAVGVLQAYGGVEVASHGVLQIGQGGVVNAGSATIADSVTMSGGTLHVATAIAGNLGAGILYGEIVGFGTVVAPSVTTGLDASGGTLEIAGQTVSGPAIIEAGAALRLDDAIGSGATIDFRAGGAGTLILDAPTDVAAPIMGFGAGDRVEFGGGITITAATIANGNTIMVSFSSAAASGTCDLTDVNVIGSNPTLAVGRDATSGDAFIRLGTAAIAGGGTVAVPGDLSGTGVADILFRNNAGGDTGWYQQPVGGGATRWVPFGATSPAYAVVGVGNFTGGSTAELMFRNAASGDTGFYVPTGGGGYAWNDIGLTSTAYTVVGVGNFTGNGSDDALFENGTNGDLGYFSLSASGPATWQHLGSASLLYSIVATGDFTGSGSSQILFRDNAGGDLGYYTMNGSGQVTGWTHLGGSSTAYSIVGIGDFAGTGNTDILFRDNASGDTGYYTLTDHGAQISWTDLGASSSAYTVVQVGDFTGNGVTDILYRNLSSGDLGYYSEPKGGGTVAWNHLGGSSAAYTVVASPTFS